MRTLAALTILAALPSTAYAQAWTRDLGSGYLDLSVSGLTGSSLYNLEFDRQDLPSQYSQIILSLYGEAGIIDRWLTITFQAELLRRSQLSDQGATLGLGDTKVGLWSGILTEPFRLSIGAYFGFPTGDASPVAGDGTDAQANEIARSLPTGDGEFDVEPRIYLGYSFGGGDWPLSHYLVAFVGYALRTSGFSDAFSYWLELGTKIPVVVLDRIWIWVRFFGLESFGAGAAPSAAGLGDGVTYTSLAAGLHAEIYKGFGVLFSVDTAVRARNIIAAIPLRGGIFYQF